MKKIDNSTATVTNLFTDGDPAVPTPATTLPAWYMNMTQVELVKLVEMAGITLDTSEEGDVLNNQIAEALAVHVAGLDYYTDTGAADAYVLGVTGAGEAQNTAPPAYFDGMRVRFLPDNDNTGGACTVNVAGLGNKNVKTGAGAGSNPGAQALKAGIPVKLEYDATNGVFKTTSSTITAAVKADMEAETANKFPDAAILKNHPGVAKFWVKFNGQGAVSVLDSYNVSSVTDNAVGDYTITIDEDFDSANWCALASCLDPSLRGMTPITAQTAGTVSLDTQSDSSANEFDSAGVYVAGFGGQ